MGVPGAYLLHDRQAHGMRDAKERLADYAEMAIPLPEAEQEVQASRCMYCGVAFCQAGISFDGHGPATGCPLHNLIPETNDLVCRGRMGDAASRLALTNPLPEFTGRVCPAPCEKACNLGLHEQPVTVRDDERAISDWAWANEAPSVRPLPAPAADAPLATVVGSGPAGLASAWELARRGWRVQVVERADRAGGLLMYGIPNMKLPKDVVKRRIRLMEESGIEMRCGIDAADPQVAADALASSDAIVLAVGATKPRAVNVPGIDADGVAYAVDYLTDSTRSLLDGREPCLTAKGRDVVIIGGGDTGTDCVATALRQGARSVRQVIRHAEPSAAPAPDADSLATWPLWPSSSAADYGQEEAIASEGADPRIWATDVVEIETDGHAAAGVVLRPTASAADDETSMYVVPAQLVLVAKGFVGCESGVLDAFGVATDDAGRPLMQGTSTDLYGNEVPIHRAQTTGAAGHTPVFLAGDAHLGSSLVVRAIADALACTEEVDRTTRASRTPEVPEER